MEQWSMIVPKQSMNELKVSGGRASYAPYLLERVRILSIYCDSLHLQVISTTYVIQDRSSQPSARNISWNYDRRLSRDVFNIFVKLGTSTLFDHIGFILTQAHINDVFVILPDTVLRIGEHTRRSAEIIWCDCYVRSSDIEKLAGLSQPTAIW